MASRSALANVRSTRPVPCTRTGSLYRGTGSSSLRVNTKKVNTSSSVKFKHGKQNTNAARERSRVKTLRTAFLNLQLSLPAVPLDTKLSKLDILLLATSYISHLKGRLDWDRTDRENGHYRDTENHVTAGKRLEKCVKIFGNNQAPTHRCERHPVKKWPMRVRLYDEIKQSVNPCTLPHTQHQLSQT